MGLLDSMVAVVAGSSNGIGRSTAELFAAEGAGLVVNSVRSVDAGTGYPGDANGGRRLLAASGPDTRW